MAATASKRSGAKSKLSQSSVKSVWSAYFQKRAEVDRRRRTERAKKKT
jgi:hypothetical protein